MAKTTMTLFSDAAPLKDHPAYVAEREARLAQLAIETPDCRFYECSDCCWLERSTPEAGPFECPECGGYLRVGQIISGEIRA